MIIHIFRQENQTDFERIEVFVVGFRDKSIDIKDGKQIITLSWNSEYAIEDLLYDDILNVYIKGDDFTKGYILPILRDFNLNDLDEFLILESILSKRDQAYKKEMETKSNILKKIIEHDTKRSVDDFKLFQELLKSVSAEERNFDVLKDLVNKNKLELNESKEKESIKNKLNKLNPEEIPSIPPELEMSLEILLSDKTLEKDVFTITETVMQVDDQKKDLTLTEKIQIKWTPKISSLCYSTKNVYNFGNFVMRKLFFIKNKNPNCSWDDFLKIRQSIMPDPSIKNYAQKREVLLDAFDELKKGIRYRNGTQIKNSLNTLLKFSKFYNDTGYAQISQQILQVLGSNWLTYFTNTKLFYQGELDYRPQIPRFLKPDGEFMAIYTGQLMRQRKSFDSHIEQTKRTTNYKKYGKTTAEMLFPKRHENIFPHIRVRYEILQNLKEVRVIPHGNYYEIEIRYKKFVKDIGLNRNKAFSIDLGVNNPLAISNNFGAQPLLIKGREYKRANYIINRESPYYRSIQGVCRDILKKVKKEEKKYEVAN